jgi:hypothetical protein
LNGVMTCIAVDQAGALAQLRASADRATPAGALAPGGLTGTGPDFMIAAICLARKGGKSTRSW